MNRSTHQIEPEGVMAYLDGELAPDAAAAVAAHLESCAECAAVAADLRAVSARMVSWQIEPAPEKLNATVTTVAALSPNSNSSVRQRVPFSLAQIFRAKRRWFWPLAGAAVAAGIVLVIATSHLQQIRSDRTVGYVEVGESVSAPVQSQSESTIPIERERDLLVQLRSGRPGASASPRPLNPRADRSAEIRAPMMIRAASVKLETKQFDATRVAIERIVRAHGGHLGQLQTSAPTNEARSLTATLRIPADRLDPALAEIKKLGRVTNESQSSDEVTGDYTDLVARLANARHTEQRLVEILRTRTGKVTDVLEVEREIADVREQIERMEAQRKTLENRVALSTMSLELHEEFEKKIEVAPPTAATLLWNALADGYAGAFQSLLALALFLLRAAPSLLLWAALLFYPARFAYRRLRDATQTVGA